MVYGLYNTNDSTGKKYNFRACMYHIENILHFYSTGTKNQLGYRIQTTVLMKLLAFLEYFLASKILHRLYRYYIVYITATVSLQDTRTQHSALQQSATTCIMTWSSSL